MIHVNRRSGEESKKKILSAATKVFSNYGYKGASMRMIARAADISIGGLYLYFRNKEDLYATLIKSRLDALAEKTEEVRDIQDPSEAMRTLITMRLNYARKHRELILVQGSEHGFTFGMEVKRKFFRQQRKIIEDIIRRGVASGKFRKCNAGEVSKIIFCVIRGFILSLVVEPDALFSPEECSNLILKGLLADGSKTLSAEKG